MKKAEEKKEGSLIKRIFTHIFIDGLSGMALGLFCTLIVGTILAQIGSFFSGNAALYINGAASVAKALTGAGIGVGVAYKYKRSPLVTISSAVAGMVGGFASKIIAGTILSEGVVTLAGPGEPLGAFLAAFTAAEIGHLVSGKTKLDILLTPIVTIASGSAVGLLVGPPISDLMTALGNLINWGTQQQPVLMGIVVAVLMGMALTLPISSAAIGVILGLSGIAAGAAVVGCCAQMMGFAVMSYRENKFGGLIAQGIGTSMLQMPNIVKKPIVWLPPIIASAVLGPISTKVLSMTCNSTGAGMGTSGLVGPIMTYQTMSADGKTTAVILIEIAVMYFVLPALLSLGVCELMRKTGLIKEGDLRLDV
ncbi:MAG: PTS sugar transporter subunit IIC [Clostridiales bacterium]|nr:PTS sugar transporter subunit IIC [Clostridiales bacterium]